MESISNELRKLADDYDVLPCYGLADRIDSEMVELPKGSDGKPINIGDVVYGSDGKEWRVSEILLRATSSSKGKYSIKAFGEDGVMLGLRPEWLTHERPDSLGRIADEIDGAKAWCDVDGNRPAPVSSISNETLHKWAERIRKLAAKDGE